MNARVHLYIYFTIEYHIVFLVLSMWTCGKEQIGSDDVTLLRTQREHTPEIGVHVYSHRLTMVATCVSPRFNQTSIDSGGI